MREYPALARLRIGCVQYLNSKPLIYGFPGAVTFDHPAGLARGLAAQQLDVALVPAFEALRTPVYSLVDGVAIGSDGPVYSVFLAHRKPLAEVRSVALDPASLTSVHLLRVLLREFHGLDPERLDLSAFPRQADAALIIGNQAIEFRQGDHPDCDILDLGEEWRQRTGLPFVFAPWLLRADLPRSQEVAAELRALSAFGMRHLEEIIRAEPRDPNFTRRYLTEHIRFGLGDREKAGLEKFRQLLLKHQLITGPGVPLRYL